MTEETKKEITLDEALNIVAAHGGAIICNMDGSKRQLVTLSITFFEEQSQWFARAAEQFKRNSEINPPQPRAQFSPEENGQHG